jgi:hypothetical protein
MQLSSWFDYDGAADAYYLRFAYTLITTLILFFATVAVWCLMLFHSVMLIINVSTWEFVSGNRISYLRPFQLQRRTPFDSGVIRNLKDCLWPRGVEWKLPLQPGDPGYEPPGFDYCFNEYYSCC